MPNYEYRCLNCQRRFEVFLMYAEYGRKTIECPQCGSSNVQRRVGRIRIGKSDESRLENLADPSQLENIDEDPKALGKMMREMSKETGEDLGPEFHEVINRLEAGQSPEQIEKDVPALADMAGGGGMAGDMSGAGFPGGGFSGGNLSGGDLGDD